MPVTFQKSFTKFMERELHIAMVPCSEMNAFKDSNLELQDIKKNMTKVTKGLPKNNFQHCFQVQQGCWNVCTVSKPQYNEYLERS